MRDLGLGLTSPQFAALTMIDENSRIDKATLSGVITYDRATTGSVVDWPVSKSFVERLIDPNDQRARFLTNMHDGDAVHEGRALPFKIRKAKSCRT